MQPRDVQVSQHLCKVRIVECGDNFRICDDFVVDDQIRNQLANEFAAIMNGKLFLSFHHMSSGQ